MTETQAKIGDQVRFLNDVGGGRITAFLSKEMVSVETEDGFEIPTYLKNLVIIEKQEKKVNSGKASNQSAPTTKGLQGYNEIEKQRQFKETNQIKGNDLPNFIFAALPQNAGNPPAGEIVLYLVNDCNLTLLYQYAQKTLSQYQTIDAGFLEPNTKIELDRIQPGKLDELPAFCFQLLCFRKNAPALEGPIQKEINISAIKFFKSSTFVQNNYFSRPAMLVRLSEHPLKAELDKLTDKDFQKIAIQKEPEKRLQTVVPSADQVEIDLHINELLDDIRGLSNAEMLKLQLETFHREMEKGLSSGIKRIIFIHGVGDGVLKSELRRELKRKYPKIAFQDASFREYGFGATMALLRK